MRVVAFLSCSNLPAHLARHSVDAVDLPRSSLQLAESPPSYAFVTPREQFMRLARDSHRDSQIILRNCNGNVGTVSMLAAWRACCQ